MPAKKTAAKPAITASAGLHGTNAAEVGITVGRVITAVIEQGLDLSAGAVVRVVDEVVTVEGIGE